MLLTKLEMKISSFYENLNIQTLKAGNILALEQSNKLLYNFFLKVLQIVVLIIEQLMLNTFTQLCSFNFPLII